MSLKLLQSVAVSIIAVLVSTSASADDETSRCIASYEAGQELRQAGRIVAARSELEVCSRDVCPALARRDCIGWLREVDGAMPTIVVGARTSDGVDVAAADLSIDGRPARQRLDGIPVPIDPGEHRIRVTMPDGRVTEEAIVIALGEKNRLVRVTLPGFAKREAPPAEPAPSRSVLPFVLGGTALALIGVGVTFDAVGSSDLSGLRSSCAPYCAESDLDAARTKIIVGDSLLLAGVVTGVVAAVLFFRDPAGSASSVQAARASRVSRVSRIGEVAW